MVSDFWIGGISGRRAAEVPPGDLAVDRFIGSTASIYRTDLWEIRPMR
jgi:hypothetical protein